MTAPAVVDFYGQCVDGLIEYLRTMADFVKHDWQITRNDAKLQKGADYFIFFRPGTFSIVGPAPASANSLDKHIDWQIIGDMYSRYKEYETAWQKFETFRAAIIFYVNINPALAMQSSAKKLPVPNGMAINVEATGEALPFESKEGLGAFIIQPLRFTIRQLVRFSPYVKRS